MITLSHKGKLRNDADARYFWFKHSRRQMQIEKYFVPKIENALRNQYKSFINAINEHGYEYAKNNLFLIIKFGEIAEVIKEFYLKSAYIESNYVLNYLRKKDKNLSGQLVHKFHDFEIKRTPKPVLGLGFDELAPIVDQYFQIYLLNKAALPISKTTRSIITRYLINQVDGGVPLNKAIEGFTALAIEGGGPLALPRATRIATTESTRALSWGGLLGAYMTGIDVEKVWITSDDERVRGLPNYPAPYSHVELDLQKAEMMDAFYNGDKIRFPGDPEAKPKNTIMCRCAMFFKEKDEPLNVIERHLGNFLIDLFSGLFTGIAASLTNDSENNN